MLYVESRGRDPLIVKDYGERSGWVRRLLAPLLMGNEALMLTRAGDLAGAPGLSGRIDGAAIALQFIDGEPLRRTRHAGKLPAAFFDALAELGGAMAARGVVHLDLSSPTNVLVTHDGRPAVVDLGGAIPRLWPAFITRRLHARALDKLRSRFERGRAPPLEPDRPEWDYPQLDVGAARFRFLDGGELGDPRPLVCLHSEAGHAADFDLLLESAAKRGRRVLAPVLPGRWGTRVPNGSLEPTRVAAWLADWLAALRLRRFELLCKASGQALGASLARSYPEACEGLHVLGVCSRAENASGIRGHTLDGAAATWLADPESLWRAISE